MKLDWQKHLIWGLGFVIVRYVVDIKFLQARIIIFMLDHVDLSIESLLYLIMMDVGIKWKILIFAICHIDVVVLTNLKKLQDVMHFLLISNVYLI